MPLFAKFCVLDEAGKSKFCVLDQAGKSEFCVLDKAGKSKRKVYAHWRTASVTNWRFPSFTCGYLSSATKVCSTVTGMWTEILKRKLWTLIVVYKFVLWKIKTQIRSCMVSHYSQVQIKISSDAQLSVTTINRGICVILNSNTVHNKIHEKSCEQYFF